MKKVDEVSLIMDEYNNLINEINQKNRRLELEKFISSKRLDAINSANEDIQKKELETELSKLKSKYKIMFDELQKKKEKEINEYIYSDYTKNSNFYEGYIKILRERLEKAYDKEIQRKTEVLKQQYKREEERLIKSFDKKDIKLLNSKSEEEHLRKLNKKLGYKNVDARQIIDLKLKNTKKLILLKNGIEKIINNLDVENVELKNTLNRIDESLKLMELTREENEILMRSMSEEESLEYKIRNLRSELLEKRDELRKPKKEIKQSTNKNGFVVYGADENQSETVKIEEEPTVMDDDFITENDVITTKNRSSLLKLIYNSLIDNSKDLSSIKLDYYDNRHAIVSLKKSQNDEYAKQENLLDLTNTSLELTEGEYLNKQKIIDSLKRMAANYKYTTFVSTEPKKEYIVSPKNINKLLSKLEKITTLELVKYVPNQYIIYGSQEGKSSHIMATEYNMDLMAGEYISKDELICELNKVITGKKLEKLKTLSQKLKSLFKHKKHYQPKHLALSKTYNENELKFNEDYIIKK